MKFLTIILLLLTCKWVDVQPSDLEVKYVEGAMMGDFEKLEFTGICGGTEAIEAHFDQIQFCKKLHQLKIKGRITSNYGEPYPYMSFVTGKEQRNKIFRNSEILTSDSTGTFDLSIDYKKGDELFIYGVGTYILRTRIIGK
tara:strand:- start:84 stop:506 length:423 start_codon:yes stop_codon:yes gene_type:complete